MKKNKLEIERKFLVLKLPTDIETYTSSDILQGYISFEPERRIRKKDNTYYRTKKIGSGKVRKEKERKISEHYFLALLNQIHTPLIHKKRVYIPLYGGLTAEVDCYVNIPGLTVVEVEFTSIDAASDFVIPEWFGEELTGNKSCSNAALFKKLANI